MNNALLDEMRYYLAHATKDQLAKDYQEIINNHDGPLAFDYIDAQLEFSQDYSSEKEMEQSYTEYTKDYSYYGYCLAS